MSCIHNKGDRAILYPYKEKLRSSILQILLHLYLGLPLFLLISGLLFNARTKTVESVSFSAINQVNAAESSGMRVMQFDARVPLTPCRGPVFPRNHRLDFERATRRGLVRPATAIRPQES